MVISDDIHVEAQLQGDRGRLQQLLSNLVANAITHGADDVPVVVRAAVEAGDLVLSVGNGGSPLGAEELDKVFEPYWRPRTSKPGGGLGLGLYICSQIVKAHGGHINVQSIAGQGTVFTARLPIVVSA